MIGYKCFRCYTIVPIEEVKEKDTCPLCGEKMLFQRMCSEDTGECHCAKDAHDSIKLCDVCNEPVCPECNSHDVMGVSRVKSEKIRSY